MNTPNIITIGRQLGSGGKLIGQELAKQLGFAFYDKELINEASKETGIAKEFFEKADEKKSFNIFSNYSELSVPYFIEGYYLANNYLTDEVLFEMQSKVIKRLAEEKPCIIIGRCADYVLRENPNCLSVFISADLEDRIRRVAKKEKLPEDKVKKHIERMDKRRASYYNYHTNKVWSSAASYDLCINSSSFGIEKCVEHIRYIAEKKWKK